ncbi:MAG: metallophosphoesterase family protein [Chloroflexi bacterium]|nr:metallophosphoesterase family protein [Chloroflexota bacterium]
MRIGLISDTHVPEAGTQLPREVYEFLRGVELILHAGDMHVIEVLDWLERIAPTWGARGNGDGDGFRPAFPDDDPRVKSAHVLTLGGLQVGLVHGFPLPGETPWISQAALADRIFGGRVDVIVCGDTHVPVVSTNEDGVLIVNPGSPMLPTNMKAPGTVAILTIEDGVARAEILHLRSLETS